MTRASKPSPAADAARNATSLDGGTISAVLLRSAVLDGALLWLVADDEVLAENPDIARSGHPVLLFSEVEQLRSKTVEELRAIAMTKSVFPSSRALQ